MPYGSEQYTGGRNEASMTTETAREKFNKLSEEFNTSAREYFMVLRLAIYHTTGEYLESSYAITQYSITEDIYRTAIRILRVLNWRRP